MRTLPALALALLALAAPVGAQLALPVALSLDAPGRVRVEVIPPPHTVQVCAATAREVACAPGDAPVVTLAARPGEALTVWAADRPYVVGGVITILAFAEVRAPGYAAYLPLVEVP